MQQFEPNSYQFKIGFIRISLNEVKIKVFLPYVIEKKRYILIFEQAVKFLVENQEIFVLWREGDDLLEVILGLAVFLFVVINTVKAEKRIPVAGVGGKA